MISYCYFPRVCWGCLNCCGDTGACKNKCTFWFLFQALLWLCLVGVRGHLVGTRARPILCMSEKVYVHVVFVCTRVGSTSRGVR